MDRALGVNDLLAQLRTAETPIASTVHEPVGNPAGPGLWHHKGMQLPAYVQHVANRLRAQGHGESTAVEMAVGIVKNWAAGHDGRGNAVHPDVQAAAVKAVAEWEALKAAAHGGKRFNPFHLGAGPGGGEFTHGGGGGGGGKAKATGGHAKGTTAAAPAVTKGGTAGKTRAQHKQALLDQAHDDRAKAHQLQHELHQLEAQHTAHVKAAKKAAATQAAQQKAGQKKINPHAKHRSPGHPGKHHPGHQQAHKHQQAAKAAAKKVQTLAQKITGLKKQIASLLTAAASLEAQAKRL